MKDLAALTAHEGVEFALFTRGSERMIIRGSSNNVNIDLEKAQMLNSKGWRWSGHTHPGIGDFVKIPSEGDKLILDAFKQEKSVIYDSKGKFEVYDKN